MNAETIDTFIKTCVGLAVLGFVYMVRSWFEDSKQTTKDLTAAIKGLSDNVNAQNTTQQLHGEQLRNHNIEIEALWDLACPNAECPHKAERRKQPRVRRLPIEE